MAEAGGAVTRAERLAAVRLLEYRYYGPCMEKAIEFARNMQRLVLERPDAVLSEAQRKYLWDMERRFGTHH